MTSKSTTIFSKQSENVNGTLLTLDVQKSNGTSSRHHQRFTIRFGAVKPKGNVDNTSVLPKFALAAAIAFNIFAILYIKLPATLILVTSSGFVIVLLFWLTHSVQYESLLVVPTVGIQSSIKYVLGKEEKFISWNSIDDVIINEVIHLNRVLYYITVLVQDSGEIKLVPLFKYTKPRLAMLESIYSQIQSMLRLTTGAADAGSGDKVTEQ